MNKWHVVYARACIRNTGHTQHMVLQTVVLYPLMLPYCVIYRSSTISTAENPSSTISTASGTGTQPTAPIHACCSTVVPLACGTGPTYDTPAAKTLAKNPRCCLWYCTKPYHACCNTIIVCSTAAARVCHTCQLQMMLPVHQSIPRRLQHYSTITYYATIMQCTAPTHVCHACCLRYTTNQAAIKQQCASSKCSNQAAVVLWYSTNQAAIHATHAAVLLHYHLWHCTTACGTHTHLHPQHAPQPGRPHTRWQAPLHASCLHGRPGLLHHVGGQLTLPGPPLGV